MKIKVKYFSKEIKPLEMTKKGNWVDLRSAVDVELKAGEFQFIPLGVGMILPDGYEALVAPRGSSYPSYKIIITNSPGVIDDCFRGNGDQWHCAAYALKDTHIHVNERICQFRIIEKQPWLEFEETEELEAEDRGGFGSTGRN